MNGTELRSFSHFQILTKIANQELLVLVIFEFWPESHTLAEILKID